MTDAPIHHPHCLRCESVFLDRSADSVIEIEFFECPSCHRRYARRQGGELTFRWGEPIGIALYGFCFRTLPEEAQRALAVRVLTKEGTLEHLVWAVLEIEAELEKPTQSVSAILATSRTELECRQFLTGVLKDLKQKNGKET